METNTPGPRPYVKRVYPKGSHGQRQRIPLTAAKVRRMTEHRRRGSKPYQVAAPIGFHFDEIRHHLSPTQCRQANALLRKLERTRPLPTGDQWQWKMALRCAGIISCVRRGTIGNKRYGHHLKGFKGGRRMWKEQPHVLEKIWPIGLLKAAQARDRKQAQTFYEEHGQVLPVDLPHTANPEQLRLHELQQLADLEQQLNRNFLSW